MPRIIKGHIYAVTFLDHVEGGDDPIEFTAYGKVSATTRHKITIDNWHYTDPKETDRSENVGRYTIVRKAITGITELTERAKDGEAKAD